MIRDNDTINRLRGMLAAVRAQTQPASVFTNPRVVDDLWSVVDQMITRLENDL